LEEEEEEEERRIEGIEEGREVESSPFMELLLFE